MGAALEKAQEQENASKAAAEQSKNDAEAAKANEKDTAKEISTFGYQLSQSRKDLTAARAEFEALMGGAMAAYKELLEYTAVVPPAPLEAEATEAPAATQ